MSFVFNPVGRVATLGLTTQAGGSERKVQHLGGLTISPEQAGSKQSNRIAYLTLVMIALGFFAASLLFVTALITVILA